jgi:hypothetical protein
MANAMAAGVLLVHVTSGYTVCRPARMPALPAVTQQLVARLWLSNMRPAAACNGADDDHMADAEIS